MEQRLEEAGALLSVPVTGLLTLWGELVECYHGVNGYGGDTPQLYAYQFQPYSPAAHGLSLPATGERRKAELERMASSALVALVSMFCNQYDCSATIDDQAPEAWRRNNPRFDWRANVKIAH